MKRRSKPPRRENRNGGTARQKGPRAAPNSRRGNDRGSGNGETSRAGAVANRPVRIDLVRAAVLEAYAAVRSEGQLADRALDRILRREKRLFSNERRAIAETTYGLLRQERRLDFLLFDGRPPASSGPSLFSLRLAALAVLEGRRPAEVAVEHGLPAGTADRLAKVLAPLPAGLEPILRVELEGSLPRFVAERLVSEVGVEEALAFARAISQRGPLTVRVNTVATTREALMERLRGEGVKAEPTQLSPQGLVLHTRTNVFALPSFTDGLFEVQDEGSQLLAQLVGARPGERVVDACAGAGGKTLALGAEMRGRGELFALDPDERRLGELPKRARRAGLFNVRVRPVPAEAAAADESLAPLQGKADRVLVDAPCSGLGALRRNPDSRYRLRPDDFERYPALQFELLRRYARLVKPGGRLVYATCSVARAEDEAVAERFLAAEAGAFEPMPAAELLAPSARSAVTGNHLRLWPQRHGTDGFFAAVFRRRRD